MNANVLRTFFMSLLVLFADYGISQDYLQYMFDQEAIKINNYNLKQYKKTHSIGDSINNCRNGQWKDVSIDSIIYWQGEYINCKPFGTWNWYYPNGDIRYSTDYDSNGKIKIWCRYYNNVKMTELHCLTKLTTSMKKHLYNFENGIINNEFEQNTTNIIKKENFDKSKTYVYYNIHFDFLETIKNLVLLVERFQGRFGIKFWDYSGKLTDEFYYCNGLQVSRINYEYKLKKLNKKKIYRDGKLRVIECYDKNGVLTKKKIIK